MIQPGEKYHLFKGIWNGEADRFKVCADCQDLRGSIEKDYGYHEEREAFGCLVEAADHADRMPEYRAIQEKRNRKS